MDILSSIEKDEEAAQEIADGDKHHEEPDVNHKEAQCDIMK